MNQVCPEKCKFLFWSKEQSEKRTFLHVFYCLFQVRNFTDLPCKAQIWTPPSWSERGRSYSLGLGPKTGSKCFKLICICMDAAMTEFKEEQGPALKASLDSLPALAWAGTLLCISAGRFRPSHQEVASQCQELSQLATKTFEWPVLLDRQKVCLINYLQVLFLQGLLHVARQIICERSSSAQQRSILHSS